MTDILSTLRYKQQERWLSLPSWCISYIELGVQVAQVQQVETRYTVALAIPTRAYASTFIALGIVLASSSRLQISEEYFQFITSQPPGTSVVYQTKNRKLRGVIERFYDKNGQIYICITTGKRETVQFPLRENVSKLVIAERDFKLRNYQKGSKVEVATSFLQACIEESLSFVTQTQLDCLIVGQLSQFRVEATETIIGLEKGINFIEGNPQDILRVQQFLGANEAYRCQIMATSSEIDEDIPLEIQNPAIVLFDGANAYLRHNPRWSAAHQIVMLDRTERSFQDAVDSINQGYIRRVEDKRLNFAFNLPDGVAAIVYQEKTR